MTTLREGLFYLRLRLYEHTMDVGITFAGDYPTSAEGCLTAVVSYLTLTLSEEKKREQASGKREKIYREHVSG